MDENFTNVDFVGLMATFSGFLVLCLTSLLDKILVLIKRAFKICKKVGRFIGTASQRLWSVLFHSLKWLVKWILLGYEFAVRKFRKVFHNTLFSTQQSRQSDYDDEEIPSGASLRLENLSRDSRNVMILWYMNADKLKFERFPISHTMVNHRQDIIEAERGKY